MSAKDKMTQAKGKGKEKIGEATDDDELRREGKADQVEGKVKENIDKASDKTKESVDSARGDKSS